MLCDNDDQIKAIIDYAVGHGTLSDAPGINHETLKAKGFTDEAIAKAEKGLRGAFDIKFVLNRWTLGADFCKSLGFTLAQLRSEEHKPELQSLMRTSNAVFGLK